jgi:hypothetical protein
MVKENVGHICTMEFYSAIKDSVMTSAGKWMELDIIMLSEISQSHKDKYCMFSLMWNLGFWLGWGKT